MCEVHYYAWNQSRHPILRDILTFLNEHGFELYDIASLTGRPKDKRLAIGDAVFVRRESALLADSSFE